MNKPNKKKPKGRENKYWLPEGKEVRGSILWLHMDTKSLVVSMQSCVQKSKYNTVHTKLI